MEIKMGAKRKNEDDERGIVSILMLRKNFHFKVSRVCLEHASRFV